MCNGNPISIGTPVLSYMSLTSLSPMYTSLTPTLPGFYLPVMPATGVSVDKLQLADLGTDCGAILIGP